MICYFGILFQFSQTCGTAASHICTQVKWWKRSESPSRCLAGSWTVLLEKSMGRKNSCLWSRNPNYMKHKHFGSLSHSPIYNSIKQISCVSSMQFSCSSGNRCWKYALKCMLTGRCIIMEVVPNLNVFAQCINLILKCTPQYFSCRLNLDANPLEEMWRTLLLLQKSGLVFLYVYCQLIISLHKFGMFQWSLSGKETKRASGNEDPKRS